MLTLYIPSRQPASAPGAPKVRAFFSLAISDQNVAFVKSSLAFGANENLHVCSHLLDLAEANQNFPDQLEAARYFH